MVAENVVWQGKPSQWTNFVTYAICILLCFLIVPIFIAIWQYLVVKNEYYVLTDNTLTLHNGVLNKHIDDVELYRIKDIRLEQPFLLRLVGLGHIYLVTSDQTNPHVHLKAIAGSKELRTQLRIMIEQARKNRGVREFDTF